MLIVVTFSVFVLGCIQLSRSLAIYNPEPEPMWVWVQVRLCMREPHPELGPMEVWVWIRVQPCVKGSPIPSLSQYGGDLVNVQRDFRSRDLRIR